MNLYVGNLSYEMSEEDLRNEFAEYGEVQSAKIITDKFTGRSRGFGFVEMASDESGKKSHGRAERKRCQWAATGRQ